MRVFPDTNVLVSALMGHGLCADLLDRLILEHTVLLGAPVLAELERVLLEKFKVGPTLWRELRAVLALVESAPASMNYPDVTINDHDDLSVLASAIDANAEVLVTGDRELVALKRIEAMDILTPRACWLAII